MTKKRKLCSRCGKEITQGHVCMPEGYKAFNRKLSVPTCFEGGNFCRVLSNENACFVIFLGEGKQPDSSVENFAQNLDEAMSCLKKERSCYNSCYPY